MNIISQRTLVKFYERYPQSKSALEVWHSDARKFTWSSPADIQKIYSSVSFLTDNRVVFNIKVNDYRLIVRIDYIRKIVRILFLFDVKFIIVCNLLLLIKYSSELQLKKILSMALSYV